MGSPFSEFVEQEILIIRRREHIMPFYSIKCNNVQIHNEIGYNIFYYQLLITSEKVQLATLGEG